MQLIPWILLSVLAITPVEWRDTIRDVYVDGALNRNVQTLTSSSPRMIAVVCGDEVLLLDPETQTVARAAKSALRFAPDHISATSMALDAQPAGKLVQTGDSTYLAHIDGKSILVTAHQSHAGPMTIDELWETAPVWRQIAETYEPDGALVERLRAIDEPVHLEVVLATWCGDSRQHVPRLLKSIALANNPNITVELTGIGPDFTTPMETIASRNITNVPTVIVTKNAKELCRFVETPASATIEEDVADIVAGRAKPHPGRYERGALLASGTYVLRDARRRHAGTERFELYERPGGGVIAHSLIARPDRTTVETWTSRDFVEVTERGAATTRTRYRRNGETWSAHSRGARGLVDQTIAAPAAFIAPATITYAWARDAASAYVIPFDGIASVRAPHARVDKNEIPKWVKLEDGSTRELVSRSLTVSQSHSLKVDGGRAW